MISNFYVTHPIILLAALVSAFVIIPESNGRNIKRWQLLVPGVSAAGGALVLIVYPDILQLWRAQLWDIGLGAVFVGAVRGYFMRKDSDRVCKLVRVDPAGDGRWAANLLVLLAVVEIVVELITPPDDHTYLPIVELSTIIPAGYLLGRSVLAWIRTGTMDHVDLRDP